MIASFFAVLPIFNKLEVLDDTLGQVHKIFRLKTSLIKFHVVKITFCYFEIPGNKKCWLLMYCFYFILPGTKWKMSPLIWMKCR